ncbi:alanine-tRNA ligase [Parasponia andersonii]|uniref:Alanine-tRNA ligase n=1 Tax=Parasponia andersonii TaxID=3476 RepID=A0A2P5CJF3_PARAD|nr:alanine-tRNA ligase [Parasponia andersonii]
MSESESEENPTVSRTDQPSTFNPQFLGQTPTPWVDYAIQQARLYQKTLEETFDSAIEASKSRLSQILSTSSAHFHQTLDSLEDIKSEYGAYEDIIFGKIKEGIFVAASHPVLAGGFATGLGFLVLKKPRQSLYHKTLCLFLSEETLLSRADAKVKALQQSLDVIKTESEKLEKGVKQAEEELIRGRTKLRQAGKQIQGLIRSAYKIERQARGLRDILGELPRREASQFRSQVSGLTLEAKRERNALTKEVTKISNYGISV